MPKNNKLARRPSVRNQMSHAEIMDKRHQKRKKKEKTYESFVGSSHYHLKEFMKLTDNEEVTKKSVARSIMDTVEEINDEGMNDKRYMDIMNQLMILNNEDAKIENESVETHRDAAISNYIFSSRFRNEFIVSATARDRESVGNYGVGHVGSRYSDPGSRDISQFLPRQD
tara:strand:- start:182 stop:691 length:510 start_codon:yes stop_codon:yes gene_type:complete